MLLILGKGAQKEREKDLLHDVLCLVPVMGVLTGDPEHHVGIPPDKSADRLFGNVLHLPIALFIDKTTRRPKTFRPICFFSEKMLRPRGAPPQQARPAGALS